MDGFSAVEHWEESDLKDLANGETDRYEYKSSQISFQELKGKIAVAASAFWNSGGGTLVVGVNDSGEIDGGIPEVVGRQGLRDWVDQVLSAVEPPGPYTIKLIGKQDEASLIKQDRVVLAISFGQSLHGPHMAPDNKYYIRAGAHSGPAGHYLVEAIRARRALQHPLLRGVLQMHPHRTRVVQLVVLNLTSAPALNVKLNFQPLPKAFSEHYRDLFPLTIPTISREQSFAMDVSTWGFGAEVFGEEPVALKLSYTDVAGRHFIEEQVLHLKQSLGPIQMKSDSDMLKAMKSLAQEVQKLRVVVEQLPEQMQAQHNEYDYEDAE